MVTCVWRLNRLTLEPLKILGIPFGCMCVDALSESACACLVLREMLQLLRIIIQTSEQVHVLIRLFVCVSYFLAMNIIDFETIRHGHNEVFFFPKKGEYSSAA